MREIAAGEIAKTVSRLFQEACHYLPDDVLNALRQAREAEESPVGREVLDRILELSVEQDMPIDDIIATGLEREIVERVVGMVQRNEYKRRQSAPGVRITKRAFGRDRRYPITSGYRKK